MKVILEKGSTNQTVRMKYSGSVEEAMQTAAADLKSRGLVNDPDSIEWAIDEKKMLVSESLAAMVTASEETFQGMIEGLRMAEEDRSEDYRRWAELMIDNARQMRAARS